MMEWISANSDALSVMLSAIMALIWIAYLQMLFLQLRRNRRPVILISRSAGRGPAARLFVSNMGAEPIYLINMIADIETETTVAVAIVTDHDDISGEESTNAAEATNEGPLGSGQYLDAGSFHHLMSRIAGRADPRIDVDEVNRITLTIAASTGHSIQIAGGRRSFAVSQENGDIVFEPEAFDTYQLRGPLTRRRLRARLERHLRAGAF